MAVKKNNPGCASCSCNVGLCNCSVGPSITLTKDGTGGFAAGTYPMPFGPVPTALAGLPTQPTSSVDPYVPATLGDNYYSSAISFTNGTTGYLALICNTGLLTSPDDRGIQLYEFFSQSGHAKYSPIVKFAYYLDTAPPTQNTCSPFVLRYYYDTPRGSFIFTIP